MMEQTIMLETAFFFSNFWTFEEQFYQNYETHMGPKRGQSNFGGFSGALQCFSNHCRTVILSRGLVHGGVTVDNSTKFISKC